MPFTLPEEEDGGGRQGGMSTQGNFRRRREPPDTEPYTCRREGQFLNVGSKMYNYVFCHKFETPPLPKICILDIALSLVQLSRTSDSCKEAVTVCCLCITGQRRNAGLGRFSTSPYQDPDPHNYIRLYILRTPHTLTNPNDVHHSVNLSNMKLLMLLFCV